jgi:Mlc titration factor MtfA (ptsG expression regulator)
MPLLVVAGVALLVVAWLLAQPFLLERRRRALRRRPFPAAWEEILARRVPYVGLLPEQLRSQLKQHIQVFLGEKSFIGCDRLVITDEVRVTIAAQACLLILERPASYFPKLHQILVYPGAFVVERLRAEPSGILQEQRQALSGESWAQGQVVLSWQDTVEGAAAVDDGRNVAIHEFAHQLDQEKGYANGAPSLPSRERHRRWSEVLGQEFARLREAAAFQLPSLLSYYGATDPAEFFAVASEVFFEQSQRLALEHPQLHEQLRGFYRVDPRAWTGPQRITSTGIVA